MADFSLSAFPNPFSTTLTLRFSLPETSDVSMLVMNIYGQQVYAEKLRNLASGAYILKWETGETPAGAYFIQISTGKLQENVKVILQK